MIDAEALVSTEFPPNQTEGTLGPDSGFEFSSLSATSGIASKTGTNLAHVLNAEISVFLAELGRKLIEDAAEAVLHGEAAPSQQAVRGCLRMAESMVPCLLFARDLHWGAFAEQDGGATFVVQSLLTDRRVSCRCSHDGVVSRALLIDEAMHSAEREISLSDPATAKEIAEWVMHRD